MKNKKIAIGCDHAGYPLKAELLRHLSERSIEYTDVGCDSAEKSVDYPEFADKLCRKIQSGEADLGILVCGTGIGMSLAANKIPGIRCALLSRLPLAQAEHISGIVSFAACAVLLLTGVFLTFVRKAGLWPLGTAAYLTVRLLMLARRADAEQ